MFCCGIRTRDPMGRWLVEVTLPFTTPQFPNFFLLDLLASFLLQFFVRAHPQRLRSKLASLRQQLGAESFSNARLPVLFSGRNQRSRSLGFEPKAFRPLTIEVSVNFTIPGHTSRGGTFWIETT